MFTCYYKVQHIPTSGQVILGVKMKGEKAIVASLD